MISNAHKKLASKTGYSFETGKCTYKIEQKNTSTTWYPQCLAATCASVVFPRPGGPHSRRICHQYKNSIANAIPHSDKCITCYVLKKP